MDDLDRLFRRLVQQLRSRYPHYLGRSFEVEEVYQVIVPYRHHRQELGIETNQDYEMAMTQLLAGERGYLTVDREMREALSRELQSPNPDTALFRSYSNRRISVAPAMLELMEQAGVTTRPDDARIASDDVTPVRPIAAAPPPPRQSVSDSGRARALRSRSAGLGSAAAAEGYADAPPAAARFDGMPLTPPSGNRPGASRSDVSEKIPPAPPRPTAAPRLEASPAPTTSAPAGRATGLTGHGSRVSAGGIGTPPSYSDGPDRDDGAARSAASGGGVASRGRVSGPTAASSGTARAQFPQQTPIPPMAAPRRSITADAIGGHCRYCTAALPEARQITFCPHCGQDLTVQQCPACSTELELGWKFCTTCGRSVAQA